MKKQYQVNYWGYNEQEVFTNKKDALKHFNMTKNDYKGEVTCDLAYIDEECEQIFEKDGSPRGECLAVKH